MIHKNQVKDRIFGSLFGLAIGDALGAPIEFKKPGFFDPITKYRSGGPFNLPAGTWTDDTSLALCLAESLIEENTFNPVDQLSRYIRWYTDGHLSATGQCFDIGNTTLAALLQFQKTGEPFHVLTHDRSIHIHDATRSGPALLPYKSRERYPLLWRKQSDNT